MSVDVDECTTVMLMFDVVPVAVSGFKWIFLD